MNDYYVDELGKITKERYIDTSTIMNNESLLMFVLKCKDKLIKNNIKIIVCKSVYEELYRHIEYNNSNKARLAINGLKIINDNPEIFKIQDFEIGEDLRSAFADKYLIATVVNNRSSRSQMVITNDHILASDIYKIKDMKSISGGAIYVCYIDKNGELEKYNELCQESDNKKVAEKITLQKNEELAFEKIGKITILSFISFFAGKYSKEINAMFKKAMFNFSNQLRRFAG